uniref:Uncharacterized protein n=1 Tax=Arundo donax TaxID=35708 RepID=A0A0A9GXQ6_ARUDO
MQEFFVEFKGPAESTNPAPPNPVQSRLLAR